MDHQLGDKPIQEEYRSQMITIAEVLDSVFNGDTRPREVGFVLLVFPYGEEKGRCNYISNGADRKDIIKLFREQANRFDTETM